VDINDHGGAKREWNAGSRVVRALLGLRARCRDVDRRDTSRKAHAQRVHSPRGQSIVFVLNFSLSHHMNLVLYDTS
jgi:hypothetical protein